MAATQSRVVELQIKLQGVQSLQELDDVTKEINDELKQINTNSQEFKKMGTLAQQANSKVKEINSSLEGITSTEKSEAVNKFGMALVGAFQGAAGASLLFGEKTSAELEKVIKQVGGLFIITDSLKKITEAFSTKNVAALKAVVAGWKESALAVKLFGTTTRAALTATGVGLLVVAIGTIAANWDKVKTATIKAFNTVKDFVPLFKTIDIAITKIQDKFGNISSFFKGIGAGIVAIFRGEDAGKAMDDAIKANNTLIASRKQYNELITTTQETYDNELELLKAQEDKEQDIINLEKNRLELKINLLNDIKNKNEDELKAYKEAVQQLKLVNIEQEKLNKKKTDEKVKKAQEDEKKRLERQKELMQIYADDADKAIEKEKEKQDALEREKKLREEANDLEAERLSLIREQQYIEDKNAINSKRAFDIAKAALGDRFDSLNKEERIKVAQLVTERLLIEAEQRRLTNVVKDTKLRTDSLKVDKQKLENDLLSANTEEKKLTIKNQIAAIDNQILSNEILITNSIKEGSVNADRFQKILTEITGTVVNSNSNLKDFVNKYSEEIQAVADLTYGIFDLYIAQEERKAELEMRNLEAIQAKREDYAAKNQELNDMLADAEGERYDDILAQIEANNAAKKAQYELEAASIAKINEYQTRAAKARKTQSIIDATIQTSLAVVEALPNIFLAALVGALGAVQIATIASQPLPPAEPAPQFALGGMLEGKSHAMGGIPIEAEGGEFIVNRKSSSMYLPLLEAINNQGKKFANGGTVNTTTPNQVGAQSLIDYNLQADAFMRALKESPIFVSVTEFREVDNRLKVVENRASIGKK